MSDEGDGTPEDLDELFGLESEADGEPDSETASETSDDDERAAERAEDSPGEGAGRPDTPEKDAGTGTDDPPDETEAAGTSRDEQTPGPDADEGGRADSDHGRTAADAPPGGGPGDGTAERRQEPDEPDVFEQLSADVADREGDPFERLDGVSGRDGQGPVDAGPPEELGLSASGGPRDADAGPQSDHGAGMGLGGEAAAGTDADAGRGDATSVDVGDPFAGDVDPRGDPFEGGESVFEEIDVTEIDPDEVWEALASAESRGSVSETRQHTYAEVPKHRYCEQCKWFSEPPDIHCTHEGTEILEFLDMETVRLVDCPIVAERRELERQD